MIEEKKIENFSPSIIGELLMIGFSGPAPGSFVTKAIREWMVGGVILFDRNIRGPEEVTALCRTLQKIRAEVSDLPLLIAADQEGGTVVRFREGVRVFPGNRALGAGGDEQTAYLQGRATGRDLRGLGINLNLAPVLDLYTAGSNRSVGLRSFGNDPIHVARLGSALIRGMQEEGVSACAKHFPGKGKAEVDSHRTLPVIDRSGDELLSRDLLPFRAAVSAGVAAVMTSHAAYPSLDGGSIAPATFSPRISGELLRKEVAFEGILITDDLGMGAISQRPDAAAEQALRAGADIALICHQSAAIGPTVERLRKRIAADQAFRKRMERSCRRIEQLKKRIISVGSPAPHITAGRELPLRIARRAITVLRDRGDNLPVSTEAPVDMIRFRPERTVEVEGPVDRLWSPETFLKEVGVRSSVEIIPLSPDKTFFQRGRHRPGNSMIICSYDARLYPGQKRLIKKILAENPEAILVILRDPADADHFPEASTVIITYGYTPSSLQVLAEVITGKEITAG